MPFRNIRADDTIENDENTHPAATNYASKVTDFHSDSFDEEDGLITAFNETGILDEFAGDLGNFTFTQTPGFGLYPYRTLFAHRTVGSIAGTTDRFKTPFGHEYGCVFQFTNSNIGKKFRGSWLFGVQDPENPLDKCIQVLFHRDHLQVNELTGDGHNRTTKFGQYIDAAKTIDVRVTFPESPDDVHVELRSAGGDKEQITTLTHQGVNRDEYRNGHMGFNIGRVGTPLYFDRVWKRQL